MVLSRSAAPAALELALSSRTRAASTMMIIAMRLRVSPCVPRGSAMAFIAFFRSVPESLFDRWAWSETGARV